MKGEGGLDWVMGGQARAGVCSTNPSEVVQAVSVVAGPLFRCLAGWQLQAGSRAMGRYIKPHTHTIHPLNVPALCSASEDPTAIPLNIGIAFSFPPRFSPLRAFWNSAQLVAAGRSLHKQSSHSVPIADLSPGGTDMRHPSRMVLPMADAGQ